MNSTKKTGYLLTLDQHCIETTARRNHQRLMDQLLESAEPAPEVSESLELLRTFLEQQDFPAIRSAHPDLAGGTGVRVRIFRDPQGLVTWEKI